MQSARIGKYTVFFDNSKEYHTLKREIFGGHCYYLELDDPRPRILDIGAHIGLSVLYFKHIFPASMIEAYEPFTPSFDLLNQNRDVNKLSDVSTYNLAVSSVDEDLTLHEETDVDAWHSTLSVEEGAWNHSQATRPFRVPAISLSSILEKKFDLVKMDVEGMEYELIKSAKNKLRNSAHWLVEVHGNKLYDPVSLVQFFEDQGFLTSLDQNGKIIEPRRLRGLAILHAYLR